MDKATATTKIRLTVPQNTTQRGTTPHMTDMEQHGVKLTGTQTGGAIINRDRRKWEGSLKGVQVTMYTV